MLQAEADEHRGERDSEQRQAEAYLAMGKTAEHIDRLQAGALRTYHVRVPSNPHFRVVSIQAEKRYLIGRRHICGKDGVVTMQGPIRILSVDDHPLIRDGIAFALQAQEDMLLVAQATNGQEGVDLFERHKPDVTLMDLQMPVMNGIDAILRIRKDHLSAKFIVLTTYSGDVQALRAFKAGAAGYILKSMLRKELIETIRTVNSGRRCIPPEIAQGIADHVDGDALTERETEVLRIVAGGCSNKVVAARLGITEDSVKGHMKNVLGKLHANDRTHAVLIAMKRGFLDA